MKKFVFLFLVFAATQFCKAQVVTISQTTNTGHWYSVNGYVGGQSFTITQAGYLTEIKFNTLGAEGVTTFEVREGQDVAGPLLYSTSINITAAGWFSVPLPNIPVCEGVYCFTQYYNDYGSLSVSNPYPGGMAYFGGSWTASQDQEFEVWQIINNEPTTPTILPNHSLCAGQSMPLTSFTVSDETPGSVVVTAVSSNTSVVPAGNIVLGGSGSSRTISLSGPVTTPGTTTITVTLSDGNCSNSYLFTVQVFALPTVSAGPDVSVCSGNSVVLTGSGTASTYTWDGGVTNGTPFTPAVGSMTYTVTGTDGNGCQSSDAAIVTTYSLPAVNFSAVPDFCINDGSYVLTEGTPAGGFYSGPGISAGTFFPGTAGVGSHPANYVYTDGNGCTASAGQTIVVNNLPIVSFSPLADICLNASPITVTGGSPAGGTYSGPGVSGTTFIPTTPGLGSHVLTYTYIDGTTGCSDFANAVINVINLPTVNAGPDTSLCTGDLLTLNGSGSAISYSWDNGVSDGVGFSVLGGATNYTVTGLGSNGCSNTDLVIVTGLALPTVNFSAVSPLCIDASPYSLVEGTPAGGTYSGAGISGGAFDPAVAGVGSHTALYTYTDGNGCINSASQVIDVNALPVMGFSPLAGACISSAPFSLSGGTPAGGTYSGTGVTAGNFAPALAGLGSHVITYTYTDGVTSCTNQIQETILVYNTPVVAANANASDLCIGESLILTGSGANTYAWDNGANDGVPFVPGIGTTTYTVTGTDLNGCQGTDQIDVTVHPLPSVSAGADQLICEGTSVTLSGAGANTYLWNNGVSNGTPFTPAVGSLSYTVIGTDLNNCQNSDTVTVTVDPMPDLIVSPDQVFCLGDTLTLTVSGASAFSWNSGSSVTNSYVVTPAGNTVVQVEGTTGVCVAVETIVLTLDDPALVSAGNDVAICPGFLTYLTATGGGTYLWSGTGVTSETDETIAIQVNETAYYSVEVTTVNGCVYSDSVLVTADTDPSCTIEPVTSFTPNGDAVNDIWKIQGIEGFPSNHVVILNRWGDVVFEEDNYDNQLILWDGTLPNGSDAPEGTYFFIIEIADGPGSTGWIQLLK